MEFAPPLLRGVLLKRYKRFLADVGLDDGTQVTAHCPNPGSMLSVNEPGSEVWVSRSTNPNRKLGYTWELIRCGDTLVGINTDRPNELVAEAIAAGRIAELMGYASLRREVRYGRNSRIDVLLEAPDRAPCLVEVKNVTMKRGALGPGAVEFPDSVTERGTKHLHELADAVNQGSRAVMLFLAQRQDGERLTLAQDIDPAYAQALGHARAAGVEAFCYRCAVTPTGIEVTDRIDVILPSPAGA